MPEARDIIIIGAGHNGLVVAFYLARAGWKPLVLERRTAVGGAAVTDEFFPGFKCSTLAHSAGPLDPEVFHEMQLERFGLEMIHPQATVLAPSSEDRALLLSRDPVRSAEQIAKFSKRDSENYLAFHRAIGRTSGVLSQVLRMTPPDLDHPGANALWSLLKTGRGLRRLGKKEMLRLLRWGPMGVADLVSEWFETEPLRAVIAARGIFGTATGPRSGGSTAVLLLRAAADGDPVGATSFPRGGMGALTQAMSAAAHQAGAEIRTGVGVERILVKGDAVSGVALASGQEIPVKVV